MENSISRGVSYNKVVYILYSWGKGVIFSG